MHVFIHNITYIERGVKCCGKKITCPKCLKVGFSNLDSTLNYFDTHSYLAQAEKNLNESQLGKHYFTILW